MAKKVQELIRELKELYESNSLPAESVKKEFSKQKKFKLIDKKALLISSLGASIAAFGSAIMAASWSIAEVAYRFALNLYQTKTISFDVYQIKAALEYSSSKILGSVWHSSLQAFAQNLFGYYAAIKILSHYLRKLIGGK